MSTPQVILQGYSREDLLQDIAILVRSELAALPKPVKDKPYLSLEEAADFLSVSKAGLYRMTSRKKIPHIKRGGKLLFSREQINAWLKESEQPAFK